MKKLVKRILSQKIINYFYHLPMAIMANVFYGFPSRKLKVIGVTGTDGKTTTVHMIYEILKAAGKKVSLISTINSPGLHVTSPDPYVVQKLMKEAVNGGCEYMVLEVTSHALDQFRFWGVTFNAGVITNITHEHLDYHKTFDNYFKTKFKLIENARIAIINKNTVTNVLRSRDNCDKGRLVTFGLSSGDFSQKVLHLKMKILGKYNIENALAAIAATTALGIDQALARKVVENFTGLTGRMEEVKNDRGIQIFIDFAHTPNALEKASKALKVKTRGRLITVFGAAGKRDEEKRALMGKIAGKLADIMIVTAEDPRGELEKISRQIARGASRSGKNLDRDLFLIGDRQGAIDFAVNKLAKKGDTVGIFGKGHERSLNLDGKHEIPWSDQEAVKKAFSK